MTNEPLSLGSAPTSSRTMNVVSASKVGRTPFTDWLTEVIFHTSLKPTKSKLMLYDSMEEPLFSIVIDMFSELPPCKTICGLSSVRMIAE